jgi:hypothetical protein
MEPKFPKEIFFVTGRKNRLYHSRGHVKLSLNHNKSDRVWQFKGEGMWIDVTEEFK